MAAVLLALASSVTWGVADFSGGMLSRRLPLAAVTVFSQGAGFLLLLLVTAYSRSLDWHSASLGVVAGLGGGAGLACFYAALSRGTMSIVAPITACSAVVPVGLALAAGERPSPFALAGSFVVRRAGRGGPRLGRGAVLGRPGATGRARPRRRGRARDRCLRLLPRPRLARRSALSTLVGARVGSLSLLAVWALVTRSSVRLTRRLAPAVIAVGLADVSANALFALASQHGLIAIVSVLGSLFPIVTVVLAHVVLRERLSPLQRLGVVVALAGVAVVAAA